MTEWLKPLGGSDKTAANMMSTDMSGMMGSLRNSTDPDRGFVKGMIPHHASAIEMALLAIQRSSDPRHHQTGSRHFGKPERGNLPI